MRSRSASKTKRSRGFTLLELMIVISIMLILVSIAVPQYTSSIKRARESVMRQDLFTLRSLISQYTLDKQKAPQSLDDLIQAGYMKQIPVDPMTAQADWAVEQAEDTISSPDQQDQGGIDDVHSSSSQIGTNGTAYNTW
jgi:general secretion pathway protein G